MENKQYTLEQRRVMYDKSIENINDKHLRKFQKTAKVKVDTRERELLFYISKLPNWETYLTEKQLEITKHYVSFTSASAVDQFLGLAPGVAHSTLFGTVKNRTVSGGVHKKLKHSYEVFFKVKVRKNSY